jgi:hypothetical protein
VSFTARMESAGGTALNSPSHSVRALRAMLSKTGWTSVGELVITRRMLGRGRLLLERLRLAL